LADRRNFPHTCLCQFRHLSKSISNGAQYVSLDSKLKCLSLALFSGNSTNKTGTPCAYTWGTTNSKPPGPIIMIDESEIILSRSQVQFSTLFFGGVQLCCAFHQPRQAAARIWCETTNFLS
jgi:hypothetical protein